jgi:predicted MFS family arabinose efflux permease
MMAAIVQAVGLALLYPLGWSVFGIVVPLVVVNMVGPTIDVTGRMTFLSLAPAIRTRLTTIYIVIMFLGGAFGSLLGPAVYDWGGWAGTSAMLVACSLGVVTLSTASFLAERRG